MFKSNLKFFVRVFLKDKFFSLLNILGLALGIAVSILLLLILQHDLNFDKHYANHERIYRLGGHLQATGVDVRVARSARELAQILDEEFPEVLATTRANDWDHTLVEFERNGENIGIYEEDVVRTDSTYFNIFKHEFIAGDPQTALHPLNSVILTQRTAKRYFGDEDPMEKTIKIDGQLWKVNGIIKDLPPNTHLRFDILLSGLSRSRDWTVDQGQVKSEAFWNPDVFTYLLMKENYDPQDFYEKFPLIFNKYFKSFGDQVGGKYAPILQPLADVHFHSDLGADVPVGNLSYLYAFSGIGVFIIILACINYMNLATAKASKRSAEIAMKKALGSGKRALALSFLSESLFLSFASLFVAAGLVLFVLSLPSFNTLIGRDLDPSMLFTPTAVSGCLLIAAIIGIISGIYPSLYLPNIPTLTALKGNFNGGRSTKALRKVLTTAQFAISIFVVICTFFMQEQINFMRNQDLGFKKENVLLLPIQDTLVEKQIVSIKNELLQHSKILAATTSHNVPGMGVGGPVMWAESETGMKQQAFNLIAVGDDYFKTMGIELVKGRSFEPGPTADVDNVFICNEAAAKLMGWGNDPVGKKVKWFHGTTDGQVVGMIKDFHYSSLHNSVEPLLIIKSRNEGGFLHLRLAPEDLPGTMAYIKEKWSGYDPNHPYEYFFLDERFDEQYRADETQYGLVRSLSFICIFISLLGLLGLSAFNAAQRTKEIGIRKVHGASVTRIIYLLYKDVMILVIVAACVVSPVAYYVITGWMGHFAYQTKINYIIFPVVTAMAMLFALATVAFHSMKTARTNPVESLKYE